MSDHPLDGARDDEALPHHQTFSSPMTKDRGGLLLLIPNRWACPLLGWTVVLGVALSLWGNFRSHLEGHVDASPCYLHAAVDFLTIALCLLASIFFLKRVTERVRKVTDELKGERTRKLTLTGKGVQPSGYRCRLWTTTECVESIKGDQILPFPLLKWDFQNTSNEALLFVANLRTD